MSEQDWAELPEDITNHALFTGQHNHPDGRQCDWHHRLQKAVFRQDGRWVECLRPKEMKADWDKKLSGYTSHGQMSEVKTAELDWRSSPLTYGELYDILGSFSSSEALFAMKKVKDQAIAKVTPLTYECCRHCANPCGWKSRGQGPHHMSCPWCDKGCICGMDEANRSEVDENCPVHRDPWRGSDT